MRSVCVTQNSTDRIVLGLLGLLFGLGHRIPDQNRQHENVSVLFRCVRAAPRVSVHLRPRVTIGLRTQYKRSDTFEVVYIIVSVVFRFVFFLFGWQEFDEFAINLTVMHKLSAMVFPFVVVVAFSLSRCVLSMRDIQATQFSNLSDLIGRKWKRKMEAPRANVCVHFYNFPSNVDERKCAVPHERIKCVLAA